MNLTDFEALSFDCYGTLIDWEAGLVRVLRPWAGRNGLTLTDAQLLEHYAPHEAQVEQEQPTTLYPEVLGESLRRLGRELGAPVEASDVHDIATSVPDWPAFPDSHDALLVLGKYYRLIILSNVDRQSFVGSQRRLDVDFTAVITAQDVGSYKPAAANFVALGARVGELGLGRGNLLHVAQSLFHDHVPAKAAGLPTVWINRRHDRPGWGATPDPGRTVMPDLEFSDLASFAAAVEAAHA